MDDLFESDTGGAAADSPQETPAEPEATSSQQAESAPETESMDDLFDESASPTLQATSPLPPDSSIRVSGFVQNELGYAYAAEDEHYSKFKTLSKVRINGRVNSRISWQLGGHLQYDPVFEFETFYPDGVEDDQKVDGYVDETFVDIDADNWEFRLGRQHIIWGEMVGLFFADVISALDLREFILPDFDLIRVPQWSLRAEYFNGDFHGDIVYIPYMTTDDFGEFGAEYFPFPFTLPAGAEATFLEDKDPNDPANDFGFGTRASYLTNGWDLSLFYYTSPDRTRALQREITFGAIPSVVFTPKHERIHQIGSTLSKDLGSFVLKAEAIQTMDRLMSVTRLTDFDGLTETDELRYVIGADWAGFDGYNANLQFFQTWFQDHDPDTLFDELETGLSLLLRTTSWHTRITPEVLWIRSLNRNEWLLQAKVTWDFATDWRGVVGTDIFEGPRTGLFGQFDKTDRVYYELRFSF